MALPRIDVPTYTTLLPSSGQQVKFRPFLVKEQKQLLIAQGGDEEQRIQAVKDVVAACVELKQSEELSAADLEYLFVQLRIRSVGETVDLLLTCTECEHQQGAVLDLQKVQVQKPEGHVNNIELDSDLVVTLKDPSLEQMARIREQNDTDNIIELIAGCITGIWKNDEFYDVRDYSITDLIDFVENLPSAYLEKMSKFFQTLPVLRHTLDYQCKQCGAENVAVLEGLQSFFA